MSQSVRQILSKRQLDQIVDFNYVFGTSGNILHVLKRAAKECLEESRRDRLQRRLRDSFGTKPADIGVPLDRIQTLMGYRMVVITRKYVQTRDQLDGKKHFASMPS